MGADRGAPATREATEKENTAAAKLREEVCREKSRILPQHPQHRAFLSGKMPVAARAMLGLAGMHFFRRKSLQKKNTAAVESVGRNFQRKAEDRRSLTIKTALPCRRSPDALQFVVSSAKNIFSLFPVAAECRRWSAAA